MRGRRLGKTGPARGQIGRDGGTVQNDECRGRACGAGMTIAVRMPSLVSIPNLPRGQRIAGNERGQQHEHSGGDRARPGQWFPRIDNAPPCRCAVRGAAYP